MDPDAPAPKKRKESGEAAVSEDAAPVEQKPLRGFQSSSGIVSGVFVLECENGKWFVGSSTDIMRRIRAQQEGRGADWTKIHVPKAVYMVREVNGDPVQELQKAELEVLLDMMRLKGIMNVRGGPHSQFVMEPSTIQGLKSKIMSKWPTCILCGSNSHTDARCDAEQAQEGAAGSSGGAVAQPPAGEATTSGQGAPGTHRGAASGEDAAAAAGGPAQDRPVCKNPGCNNVLANRIIKNGGTMCSKCLAMGYVKPSCKQCQCPLPEACVKNNVPICPVCLSGSLPVQESV